MKQNLKLIIALISLYACSLFGQSTTNSYTRTLQFLNSDNLQIYEGARIAAPSMTLPNSLTTYTSTLQFTNSDNRQIYNAIRGIGDAVSSATAASWLLSGNAITGATEFLGTTNNFPLYFKTNNVTRAGLNTDGSFYVGNGSTGTGTLGILRTISGGGTVDIGNGYDLGAIWLQPQATKTNDNWNLLGVNNDLIVQGHTDSSKITFSAGNSISLITLRSKQTSIGTAGMDIQLSRRSNSGATFNLPNVYYRSVNTQWLTGAITTQAEWLIDPPRYSAVAASTITNAYTIFASIPTASTNMAITRAFGFGTNGSAHITQSLVLGSTAKTPVATLDNTGSLLSTSGSTFGTVSTDNIHQIFTGTGTTAQIRIRGLVGSTTQFAVYTGNSTDAANNYIWTNDGVNDIRNASTGLFGRVGNTTILHSTASNHNVTVPISINTTETNASTSALLEITSTTKGVLFPRMTTAQKNSIASPVAGLVVYDTTLNKLCVYTTAWETITSL